MCAQMSVVSNEQVSNDLRRHFGVHCTRKNWQIFEVNGSTL